MTNRIPVVEVRDVSHIYYRPVTDAGSWFRRVKALFMRERESVFALSHVSFSVGEGESVAVLGPNGAGKSTLLKIILGVLKPSSGSVSVFGYDPYRYRRKVSMYYGVVFGNRDLLWWHVPVIDSLKLLARAYGLDDKSFNDRLSRYAGLLCSEELLRVPPQRMSLGQRRRCEFLAALIHNPRLLVLDEPFLGLDLFVRERIRRILELYLSEGGTIILSTHELSEIPENYRVLLLHRGELLYDGSYEDMARRIRPVRFITIVSRRDLVSDILSLEVLDYEVEEKNGLYVIRLEVEIGKLNSVLASLDYSTILDIRVAAPSLETVIRGFVEQSDKANREVSRDGL